MRDIVSQMSLHASKDRARQGNAVHLLYEASILKTGKGRDRGGGEGTAGPHKYMGELEEKDWGLCTHLCTCLSRSRGGARWALCVCPGQGWAPTSWM